MTLLQYTSTSRYLKHTHSLHITHHRLSHRASDKLFADAEHEESGSRNASSNSQKLNVLEQQHENWTGDERIQDAVLRMLVDKYKPLRGPSIITAEEKLKRSLPKVSSSSASTIGVDDDPGDTITTTSSTSTTCQNVRLKPQSGSWANEPLLPSNPAHKPWDTKFKAPSDSGALNIKLAQLPPPQTSVPGGVTGYGAPGRLGGLGQGSTDERLVRKEKEGMKKVQQSGRLSQALESTLDYRLGIKNGQKQMMMQPGKPKPVSVKGWNSLVEERIEVSRALNAISRSGCVEFDLICRNHGPLEFSRM
jgi:hypothetical protein